jgi:hypothetical protein
VLHAKGTLVPDGVRALFPIYSIWSSTEVATVFSYPLPAFRAARLGDTHSYADITVFEFTMKLPGGDEVTGEAVD